MNPLRYKGYAIALEEIPNEISLAFNISGCPYRCDGCHSQYLWNYSGDLLIDNIERVLNKYYQYITCVCFMGGDQNIIELEEACEYVKDKYHLKTAIYSGNSNISTFQQLIDLSLIDYLKIGKYIKERGGLSNPKTNQRMYFIQKKDIIDITYLFQKKII